MSDPIFDDPRVATLLDLALREDVGDGDRTSEATVPDAARARGRLLAKEPLVVCGLPLVERVFARLGGVAMTTAARDGDRVDGGAVLAVLDGKARVLLAGERLALNFVQHLSGIATLTAACVDRARGTKLVVRDTRKTVPGLRVLEKYAVRCGGGQNHRSGLFDGVLVKENHLRVAGGVTAALAALDGRVDGLPVEVEAETLAQVREALDGGAPRILLDNMSPEEVREAVELTAGRAELEASGGVSLGTVRAYAETGVDFVSVGALTHSARSLHVSLEVS
jgi:nicotinate-nucleotide pyrophosphorylase (carboxylating)